MTGIGKRPPLIGWWSVLRRSGLGILSSLFLMATGPVADAGHSQSSRSGLTVTFGKSEFVFSVITLSAMPDTRIGIRVSSPVDVPLFIQRVGDESRQQVPVDGKVDVYTDRTPGVSRYQIFTGDRKRLVTVNVIALTPLKSSTQKKLNGYRIGQYPTHPTKSKGIFKLPLGFIEINAKTKDLQVSPHFRLGQFAAKQASTADVKYVLLRPELLEKLEFLLEKVNENGWKADTFTIMSGYRTPFYNKAIGNVQFSRHVWGGAADIYIDTDPRDGVMDDLNGDGKINKADAIALYDFINSLTKDPAYRQYIGGLGAYGSTAAHGPFVHVDVRGSTARWGR